MALGAFPAPAAAMHVLHAATDIERLRARDPDAWSQLFESTHREVYRAALIQVRDPHIAEDIMAQVYLEALTGIARYRDRGRPILAWLLAIARHRALDTMRKRRRNLIGLTPTQELQSALPEDRSLSLLHALSELTPAQREVLHLRFVEERSLEQVAALTGRSVGAVKALQHRAILRLRAKLDDSSGR